MREVVRERFYDFNLKYEGGVNFLYQDLLGLVSIGVGILVDPIERADYLPLIHPDGRRATIPEIRAEWTVVKNLPGKNGKSAALLGHRYVEPFIKLRLTEEGLRQTLQWKLDQQMSYLAKRFPEFAYWPSDAQLATLSMSWACGPAFRFPKLEAALKAMDFRIAAIECRIRTEPAPDQPHGNPGVVPRNKANKQLYTNAAIVMEQKLDPETLHWPADLSAVMPKEEPSEIRPDQLEDDPQPIVHAMPDWPKPE